MTPRAAPLPQPWSPEDEAGIRRWMHPEGMHDPPVLFQVLQRHPVLAKRMQALGQELYVGGRLPARERQIAIMRACALVGCAYEWGGQATFWGPRVGVSEAECDALVTGRGAEWSARERTLLAAVDAVEDVGGLDDAGGDALRGHYDDEQIIELLAAVGWYRMICTFCNALDLRPEPWMRAWPAP